MTTLRDMPMITIEQKNRFREAALKVEAERDELAAQFSEMASLADSLTFASSEGEADEIVQKIAGLIHDEGGTLVRRDASMKTEAFSQAVALCVELRKGQESLEAKYLEIDDEGEPVVVGDGINYANKALGISHCIDRLEGCADQYRQQAEGKS